MGSRYNQPQTEASATKSPSLKTIEVELPSGGGGSPSCDMLYEEAVDRVLQQAIPLGGRYVKHTTRTIHKIVATVTYEEPQKA